MNDEDGPLLKPSLDRSYTHRAKNRSDSGIQTSQKPSGGGLDDENEPLLKPSLDRSHTHRAKRQIRFRHTNLAGPLSRRIER